VRLDDEDSSSDSPVASKPPLTKYPSPDKTQKKEKKII